MDTLHITTPADLISLIGHSLGYWPRESLVCVTLQNNRMGATLRLDLPSNPDHTRTYARRVTDHLRTDADATARVFAIFADAPRNTGQQDFFRPIIHELTQHLTEAGMPIRAGRIVGPASFAEYQPRTASYGPEVPLAAVRSNCINAELIGRGSQVQDKFTVALPDPAPRAFTDHVRRRESPTTATVTFAIRQPRPAATALVPLPEDAIGIKDDHGTRARSGSHVETRLPNYGQA